MPGRAGDALAKGLTLSAQSLYSILLHLDLDWDLFQSLIQETRKNKTAGYALFS